MLEPANKKNKTALSVERMGGGGAGKAPTKVAEAEKPGAVHIELPEDIAKHTTEVKQPLARVKLRRPAPDHKSVKNAVALLKNAKRPLVIAGNGCVRKRASTELRRLVEKTGAFVANTFMGKGAIDYQDAHSLMTIGLGLAPECRARIPQPARCEARCAGEGAARQRRAQAAELERLPARSGPDRVLAAP